MEETQKNMVQVPVAHRAWITQEGILHLEFIEPCFPLMEQSRAIIQSIEELSSPGPVPILADIRKVKGLSAEGSKFVREKSFTIKTLSACAILVGSPISRLVGSFFVGINKPPFPTRLFTKMNNANNWLRNFQH